MNNLQEKRLNNIWHLTAMEPKENIVINKAKGVWLETEDGKNTDAVSWW